MRDFPSALPICASMSTHHILGLGVATSAPLGWPHGQLCLVSVVVRSPPSSFGGGHEATTLVFISYYF
jgi:hypothetical protein